MDVHPQPLRAMCELASPGSIALCHILWDFCGFSSEELKTFEEQLWQILIDDWIVKIASLQSYLLQTSTGILGHKHLKHWCTFVADALAHGRCTWKGLFQRFWLIMISRNCRNKKYSIISFFQQSRGISASHRRVLVLHWNATFLLVGRWKVSQLRTELRSGGLSVKDLKAKHGRCSSTKGRCQNTFRAILRYHWARYQTHNCL